MSSFEPRRSFEHLDKLCYEIGPRLSGTERSRKAAEYIKNQFEEYGFETEFQEFDFVDKVSEIRVKVAVMAGAFVASLFLSPLVAVPVAIAALGFYFLLPRVMPGDKDRNVIARLQPEGEVERSVVIGAHYDTAHCSEGREWAFFFKILFPILTGVFMLLLILRLFVIGGPVWLVLWTGLAVPYLFTCILPFWLYGDLVSSGANDNASGVSVMLEVARVISESPLEKTEMRFVAFGGEEQGLIGSKKFAEQMEEPDFLLNLDSVGSGDKLCLIRGNGVFRRKETTPNLNEKLGELMGSNGIWAPFSGHDHISFLKKGVRATTLSSRKDLGKSKFDKFLESLFGLPSVQILRHPDIHTLNDAPEKIELENIRRTGGIVLNFIGVKKGN